MENKFLVKNRDIDLHLRKFKDGDSFISFQQPPGDDGYKQISSKAEFLSSFDSSNEIVEIQTHSDFNLIKVTSWASARSTSLSNVRGFLLHIHIWK